MIEEERRGREGGDELKGDTMGNGGHRWPPGYHCHWYDENTTRNWTKRRIDGDNQAYLLDC